MNPTDDRSIEDFSTVRSDDESDNQVHVRYLVQNADRINNASQLASSIHRTFQNILQPDLVTDEVENLEGELSRDIATLDEMLRLAHRSAVAEISSLCPGHPTTALPSSRVASVPTPPIPPLLNPSENAQERLSNVTLERRSEPELRRLLILMGRDSSGTRDEMLLRIRQIRESFASGNSRHGSNSSSVSSTSSSEESTDNNDVISIHSSGSFTNA